MKKHLNSDRLKIVTKLAKETLLLVLIVGIVAITAIATNFMNSHNIGGQASLTPISTQPTYSTALQIGTLSTDNIQGTGCSAAHPECATTPSDDCDVRNQDFYMTQGYAFPNGINICADNRIVDCQGHTLTGIGLNMGIKNTNFDDVTIRNCVVTNYNDDINVRNSKRPTITGNTLTNVGNNGLALLIVQNGMISNNRFDMAKVLVVQVYNTFIQGNTLTNSGGSEAFGSALDLRYSDGDTLTQNTINNNPGNGILLDHSHNNRILSNIITNNGKLSDSPINLEGSGIDFEADVTNTLIQGNTITRNNNGITLDTGQFNTITGNVITNNLFNGITLESYINLSNLSSDNTITNNQINNNGENGIFLFGGLRNTIQNNQINNNGQAGINASTDKISGQTTQPNNNILTMNTIDKNGVYGIFLSDAGSEAVNTNEVCFNGQSDFQLQNSSGNMGDQNKCDNYDGWNDATHVGCTYPCIQANTTQGCGTASNCSVTCPAGQVCTGNIPGGCGGNCTIVGAVNWAYYNATCGENNTIHTYWGTTSEVDTLGFYVQWSNQKTGTYTTASPFIFATGSGSNYYWPDTNTDGSPNTPKNGIYNWYKIQEQTTNGPGDTTSPFTTDHICDETIHCGGIANTPCPEGMKCVCPPPNKTGGTTNDELCNCMPG